jgi:hypothetical protein
MECPHGNDHSLEEMHPCPYIIKKLMNAMMMFAIVVKIANRNVLGISK